MNSLSYLSNFFNSKSNSTKAIPTQDDSTTEEGGSDTIYLSARAGGLGGKPIITISSTEPSHLASLRRLNYTSGRSANEIPLPDSPILEGVDEDWLESVEDLPIKTESQLESEEGERRLRVKDLDKIRLERAGKSLGMRITVRLFFVIRSFLHLMGFYQPIQKLEQQKTNIDPTEELEKEELLEKLTPLPIHLPPSASRASSFFPSRSASPIPIPRPPRLTPKTLVLDLDETLIHSTSRPYTMVGKRGNGLKVRVVEVILDGRRTVYTVYKRPWVDFFLRKVSSCF